jgi:hypothetical protein
MQDEIQSVIKKLQACKQQGMPYAQAVQSLLAQGCSQELINQASDSFQYVQSEADTSANDDLDEAKSTAVFDEAERKIDDEMGPPPYIRTGHL